MKRFVVVLKLGVNKVFFFWACIRMMFNLSLILGEVPQLLKHAIVRAIPKSSKNNDLSNIRPINLTHASVKVMERLIRDNL